MRTCPKHGGIWSRGCADCKQALGELQAYERGKAEGDAAGYARAIRDLHMHANLTDQLYQRGGSAWPGWCYSEAARWLGEHVAKADSK